jgi:hypothetical protein
MLLACTNEKGAVNVCLFESNDYGMTRVRRRIIDSSSRPYLIHPLQITRRITTQVPPGPCVPCCPNEQKSIHYLGFPSG